MILPLNFATTFYDLNTLISMPKEDFSADLVEQFKKITSGKIIFDSARIIPLSCQKYAIYNKETCLIDDEARADCFSEKKYIKEFTLYDPIAPEIAFDIVMSSLSIPLAQEQSKAIGIFWYYDCIEGPFFETIKKLQNLVLDFVTLFPHLTPHVLDIGTFKKTDKIFIRTIFEKLPTLTVTPEFTYKLARYDEYHSHIHELIEFLNTLYEQKLAHGDLTVSNLVLKKNGGIKCLLDFDTASRLDILQGRYIKAWCNDLMDAANAMVFYQTGEAREFYASKLEIAMAQDEEYMYLDKVMTIQAIHEDLKEKLSDYRYRSDTSELNEEELAEFLEIADPKKIFHNL